MSISPGSIVPGDSLIGPIQQQLALVAQQIQGISAAQCIITPTDAAPQDDSVIFPLRSWDHVDDTNAKMKVKLTFEILHCFRRDTLEIVLPRLQPYIMAWFTALTAWSNQTLGGLAIEMNLVGKPGKLSIVQWGGDTFLAISNTVEVLTEFNINVQ